jgi:hypothetical protein
MYKVLEYFKSSNEHITDLIGDLNSFAVQNNIDLTNINSDLNSFAAQNNDDLSTIIERLPVSGFTNGYTFENITVPSNIEVFVGVLVNTSPIGGITYIQQSTISMLEDLKPDRYRIYKGTTLNLSGVILNPIIDTHIQYSALPTVVNNGSLKKVYDETIAHDVSAIKISFTDIQLKLEPNDILLILAENLGAGPNQTCHAFTSWYDV